ncbi:beta-xylosidase XylA [Aspergillus clavatus NRRL 1]|uniref:beta-xylosidase XylA n=1 Tax=Aspergillus clavatus (strain ATCC 1007 / CBS 513.65 / DSM 816 / NCTC 3887 / NRRL 1 / QM 1276 / 107) TaxID=344612 RepID=UPI0000EA589C|nr:beta-xylosidase XylA [Aspergillus clavatus NRRL 1]EAW07155.1 beta-xylosidase XylA [Aspergillus clavatus NRRL 1]
MSAIKSIATVLAAILPSVLAQANTSYADYNTEANPDLTPQSVATIDLSFPDCDNGPLSKTIVCDTLTSPYDRAAALISLFTLEELVNATGNTSPGVPRLGLPPYQVWNEALHGLDRAYFTDEGQFSWSTSFPMPILTMSALNRTLINQVASIISTQGRAFSNAGRYGLDVYSPNINSFRHPVWGRGQETPGEDAYCLSSAYAYEYITGIQGGVDPKSLKLVATAKHYAGYDIENWDGHSRLGNDMNITQQDLSEYYTPQFLVAARDAKVRSVMCSYNAVNGVPSCANSFFLQTLLRDTFGFVEDGYISSDCDSAYNVFNPHEYAANVSSAAADSIRAGTDIDCGTTYQYYFDEAVDQNLLSRADIERGVIRLYSNLMRLGYFDVGPWMNVSTQLQGNYFGPAPYLISPLDAFRDSHLDVNYAFGTNISSNSTDGFSKALSAAKKSDAIIFAGGIDNSLEAETLDRMNITWPGKQLELIDQLSQLGKPLIVLQMGGGQVDSSLLKSNKNVNSLIWGGYPGQSGGQALLDIITGKRAPAGRLVVTQYPAEYATQFPATDMSLRPHGNNPGQTYMWYTGTPVYEFGHGLFYTTFRVSHARAVKIKPTYNIQDLLAQPHPGYIHVEQMPFLNFTVDITNTGKASSDYTAMLFANTTAGPAPYPKKWLVGFDRLPTLGPSTSKLMTIPVTINSMARTDELGNRVLYPGKYELALNNERSVVLPLSLTGKPAVLSKWPLEEQLIPLAKS